MFHVLSRKQLEPLQIISEYRDSRTTQVPLDKPRRKSKFYFSQTRGSPRGKINFNEKIIDITILEA